MATVNPIISQFSSANSATTLAQKTVSKDDFIKLMLAQIQNQDPLNPIQNAEFVSQLAQISTLESINELNKSFSSVSDSLTVNQTLQGAVLVGKSVQIKTSTGNLVSGGEVSGSVIVPQNASSVTVKIKDSSGNLIRELSLGDLTNDTAFTWDGLKTDGSPASAGNYTFTASGTVNGNNTALDTALNIKVNSVAYSQASKKILLDLANGSTSVPLTSVLSISE